MLTLMKNSLFIQGIIDTIYISINQMILLKIFNPKTKLFLKNYLDNYNYFFVNTHLILKNS